MTAPRVVAGDGRMAGLEIASLRDLNALPGPLCEGLYARLVPAVLLDRVGVDPRTGANGQGERLLRVTAPPDQSWARVELRMAHEDRDPLLLVDVEIGPFGVPELSFVQIADPRSERFDIDYDGEGRDTLFGTVSRNLPEERRALEAGLAPGQVRRGLRLLGDVLDAMGAFCHLLGQELFLVEPLFYHSALLYERRGCGYLLGQELMDDIHRGFQPGGPLHAALDGSSPFRQPGFDRTVRGRSWAIHDGILSALGGATWNGVKMYRQTGRVAGVSTFPLSEY